MRNRFDEQLESLNNSLIRMGALCESAIANATKALLEGDRTLAGRAIEADSEIDQAERAAAPAAAGGARPAADFLGPQNDHRHGADRRSGVGYL